MKFWGEKWEKREQDIGFVTHKNVKARRRSLCVEDLDVEMAGKRAPQSRWNALNAGNPIILYKGVI